MRREILFKGKRTNNLEWVEGSPLIVENEYRIVTSCLTGMDDEPNLLSSVCAWVIDPNTLCQYTGLPDKNSKKIWENDICKIDGEDGHFIIKWDDEGARFVLDGEGLVIDFDNFYSCECEVVGNIFDNPELLKED